MSAEESLDVLFQKFKQALMDKNQSLEEENTLLKNEVRIRKGASGSYKSDIVDLQAELKAALSEVARLANENIIFRGAGQNYESEIAELKQEREVLKKQSWAKREKIGDFFDSKWLDPEMTVSEFLKWKEEDQIKVVAAVERMVEQRDNADKQLKNAQEALQIATINTHCWRDKYNNLKKENGKKVTPPDDGKTKQYSFLRRTLGLTEEEIQEFRRNTDMSCPVDEGLKHDDALVMLMAWASKKENG